MKKNKFLSIILFISITILATIGLQIYWNLKNYQENKLRVINEVQIAFDRAIEKYYIAESKKNTVGFFAKKGEKLNIDDLTLDTVFEKKLKNIKSIIAKNKANKKVESNIVTETYFENVKKIKPNNIKSVKVVAEKNSKYNIVRGKKAIDSVVNTKKTNTTKRDQVTVEKLVFSIVLHDEVIDFKSLSKFFSTELGRKKINIDYNIQHIIKDKAPNNSSIKNKALFTLKTESKSNFLPDSEKLNLQFSDPTLLILNRSLTGIILSLLLSLSIIGCLIYLFKIINKQKRIDSIKNDLISNITHEFKTPITTISSAIEGIKHFNTQNDTEKTNRYLSISEQQIHKLTSMVEKLLETASLDSEQLQLKKENVNLVFLLQSNIEKHQLFCPEKRFYFESNLNNLNLNLDAFHFENVVSNLLDNAIKYGGTDIDVALYNVKNNIEISFSDNGFGIAKPHQDKIFDQFYRIEKGNIHNVKGFGIGLYYSKKIIEKHGGLLKLETSSQKTTFKISLPNG